MLAHKKNITLVIAHPLLFSAFIVIRPFSQFAGLIPPGQIVVSFGVVCASGLFLDFIIKRAVKGLGLRAAVLSPLLIILFSYGTLYEGIRETTQQTRLRWPALALGTLALVIALVVFYKKVRKLHDAAIRMINLGFCIIACTLIISYAFIIKAQYASTATIIRSSSISTISADLTTSNFPDIYYVVLDEFAAPSQMRRYFQYDMSPFVDLLVNRGFIVSEMNTESLSTATILDSILNMRAERILGENTPSRSPSYRLLESVNSIIGPDEERMISLRNGSVIRYLKSLGYEYIHLGSWFAETRYNQLADQNINTFGFGFTAELPAIILNNSILRPILIDRHFHRKAVLDAFDVLGRLRSVPRKPMFVFAHIICPHSPYIFGANGEKLGLRQEGEKDERTLYINQHVFISKKVIEFIDKKMSSSQPEPIIVIQADHGARMDRENAHHAFCAVTIPGARGEAWRDSISSANTFRLLFNEIFGTKLAILE